MIVISMSRECLKISWIFTPNNFYTSESINQFHAQQLNHIMFMCKFWPHISIKKLYKEQRSYHVYICICVCMCMYIPCLSLTQRISWNSPLHTYNTKINTKYKNTQEVYCWVHHVKKQNSHKAHAAIQTYSVLSLSFFSALDLCALVVSCEKNNN